MAPWANNRPDHCFGAMHSITINSISIVLFAVIRCNGFNRSTDEEIKVPVSRKNVVLPTIPLNFKYKGVLKLVKWKREVMASHSGAPPTIYDTKKQKDQLQLWYQGKV